MQVLNLISTSVVFGTTTYSSYRHSVNVTIISHTGTNETTQQAAHIRAERSGMERKRVEWNGAEKGGGRN